jgi:DNA-binding CsgD family transcriptional regulator
MGARTEPLGLTKRQAQALELLAELGWQADVAVQMGISLVVLKEHLRAATFKLAAPNALVACVLWDRLRRGPAAVRSAPATAWIGGSPFAACAAGSSVAQSRQVAPPRSSSTSSPP